MGAVITVAPSGVADAIAEAKAAGYHVARIDCATAESLIADLTTALRWQQNLGFTPQGLNLDALYDALHHEPSADRPRLALVFVAYDALTARDPRRAAMLPDVIAQRAAELTGPLRLMALFETDTALAKV